MRGEGWVGGEPGAQKPKHTCLASPEQGRSQAGGLGKERGKAAGQGASELLLEKGAGPGLDPASHPLLFQPEDTGPHGPCLQGLLSPGEFVKNAASWAGSFKTMDSESEECKSMHPN